MQTGVLAGVQASVLPVEGMQQVQLCSVCGVDEFTLDWEEAAIFSTLRRRRRPGRAVKEPPGPHLTAAGTCRSEVSKSMSLMISDSPANTV